MRFVAAIDTVIYGVAYLQGSEVDVSSWDRKQVVAFLDGGLMAPAQLTAGAISDALEFVGQGVTVSTDGPKTVVTIAPDQLSPQALDWLTDVDVASPVDGAVLTFDAPSLSWRGVIPVGGVNTGFYRHIQDVPSADWVIVHNLGFYPGGSSVIDSAGSSVEGDIEYTDTSSLTLHFSAPFAGTANLS